MQAKLVSAKLPYQHLVPTNPHKQPMADDNFAEPRLFLNIRAIASSDRSARLSLNTPLESPNAAHSVLSPNHSKLNKVADTKTGVEFKLEQSVAHQEQNTGANMPKSGRRNKRNLTELVPLHNLLLNVFMKRPVAIEELDLSNLSLHTLVEVLIRKNKSMALSRIGKEVSIDEIYDWVPDSWL